jgi:8-oxo-dGTP diphosphatase
MGKNTKKIGNIFYWLAWPALFFYLRGSRRSRIIVSDGDNILLIKNWLGPGSYTLPGGGLKKDEDPVKGVVRELEEETGIRANVDNLMMIKPEYLVREKGHSYQCYGYSLKIDKDTITARQKFEIAEIKWVSVRDVLEKYQLTSSTRELISSWLGQDHLID